MKRKFILALLAFTCFCLNWSVSSKAEYGSQIKSPKLQVKTPDSVTQQANNYNPKLHAKSITTENVNFSFGTQSSIIQSQEASSNLHEKDNWYKDYAQQQIKPIADNKEE